MIPTRAAAPAQNEQRFSGTIMLKPHLGAGNGGAQRNFFSNPPIDFGHLWHLCGQIAPAGNPKRRRVAGRCPLTGCKAYL